MILTRYQDRLARQAQLLGQIALDTYERLSPLLSKKEHAAQEVSCLFVCL